MSTIPIKPRSPRINWSNPLAKKLIFDVPLFEGGGTTPKDVVRNEAMSFAGTPTWSKGAFGPGVVCNGSTDGVVSTVGPDITSVMDNWTAECWFSPAAISGETVMMNAPRVNDNGLYSMEIESSLLKFLLNGKTRVSTGITPVVGKIYQMVLRRQAGTTVAFVNGVLTSATTATAPDGSTVNNINLGVARSTGSTLFRYFNGTVYLGRHWERPLENREVAQLYKNPWQIYTYKKFRFFIPSAGGTAYTQTFNDTITPTDSIVKGISKSLSESITITDSIIKAVAKIFTETITTTDNIKKGVSKSLADTITITDTLIRAVAKTLSEIVTATDSLIKSFNKTLSETITITESFIKSAAKNFSDNISITDTFSTIKSYFRSFTNDVIDISESILKYVTKSFSESVVISDTISSIRGYFRTFSDISTITDDLSKAFSKILNETITVTDSIIKSISKSFSDTLNIIDSITKDVGKSFNDTLDLVDSIVKAISKNLSDILTIDDDISKNSGRAISFTDTITPSDSLSKIPGKMFSDVINMTDSIVKYINGVLEGVKTIAKRLTITYMNKVGNVTILGRQKSKDILSKDSKPTILR